MGDGGFSPSYHLFLGSSILSAILCIAKCCLTLQFLSHFPRFLLPSIAFSVSCILATLSSWQPPHPHLPLCLFLGDQNPKITSNTSIMCTLSTAFSVPPVRFSRSRVPLGIVIFFKEGGGGGSPKPSHPFPCYSKIKDFSHLIVHLTLKAFASLGPKRRQKSTSYLK